MKLAEIQQALFAAYDLRNAMTTEEKYQPTENDTYGESLALIVQTLENLEAETEKEVEETEHYSKIFDTNHGENK